VQVPAIELPPVVRQVAAHLGEPGERWLRDVPAVIASLARDWSITVGPTLAGGTAGYVAHARTADGLAAVLKVSVPAEAFARQAQTMAAAQGRGYARLLAQDAARNAILIEALGPSMDRLAMTPERMIESLCATLQQAWQVPCPAGAVAAGQRAAGLHGVISRRWERLGHPCSARIVEQALRFAERRAAAFRPDRCVVVHGDPHPGNALQASSPRRGSESGFVFVDPDGFHDDPAYDLGVILRDWSPQLLAAVDAPRLAGQYCERLAAATGIDEESIWEWGFLERVSTGLYALSFGSEELGRPYLDTAELLVR
jgi:streptomycin 6-kinase